MDSIALTLSLTLFFALLLSSHTAFSVVSPESSPSPSPDLPPQNVSPSPAALSPSAPSLSPELPVSPPAPPPSDLAPNSPSPAPSSGDDDDAPPAYKKSPSPAPAPDVVGDVSREDQSSAGNLTAKDESSGGMSGGKKAGVAIGVIAAGCVVGVLALVYKKRQQNIRRAQYGYAARRDILYNFE